jgi:hypothetical protein
MPTTMSRIQDERLTGAVALVIALAGVAYANFGAGGDNGGAGPFAVTAVVLVLLGAWVFGRVVPATEAPAKVATWCAAIAVVTLLAFWSGLPILLGVAAIAAGARANSTGGTVAAAVGALAAVAGLVGCILG